MAKKILYLLLIVLTIVIGTYFYCCLIKMCNCTLFDKKELPKVETPIVKLSPTLKGLNITDETGEFKLKLADSFNFNSSEFTITDALTTKLKSGLNELKQYLTLNTDKSLNIIGLFKSDEINNSVFENLGFARANAIKNYLVGIGFSAKQINIHGLLDDGFTANENGKLFGPVNFNIITHKIEDLEALKTKCDQLKDTPVVLHFKTGSTDISLTKSQKIFFTNLIDCVDHLDQKIDIVGHTDNTGSSENNLKLGLKRAQEVKSFLITKGILGSSIITESKGETVPISTNDTEAGMAENRRTEITLK